MSSRRQSEEEKLCFDGLGGRRSREAAPSCCARTQLRDAEEETAAVRDSGGAGGGGGGGLVSEETMRDSGGGGAVEGVVGVSFLMRQQTSLPSPPPQTQPLGLNELVCARPENFPEVSTYSLPIIPLSQYGERRRETKGERGGQRES